MLNASTVLVKLEPLDEANDIHIGSFPLDYSLNIKGECLQQSLDAGFHQKVEVKEENDNDSIYNSGDFNTIRDDDYCETPVFKRPRLNPIADPIRRLGIRSGIVNSSCVGRTTNIDRKRTVIRQSSTEVSDPCSIDIGEYKELKWEDLPPREVKGECTRCRCSAEAQPRERRPSTSTEVPGEDSLRMFFEAMYQDTRALPPHLQIRTRRILFQAVADGQDLAGMTDPPPAATTTHEQPPNQEPQRTATPNRSVSSSEQLASNSNLPE